MNAIRFALSISLGVILASLPEVQADDREFLDSIHDQQFPKRATWAVFLGTGWSKESLQQIEQWKREGRWMNPFTGKPFTEDTKIFVFGHKNPAFEGLRIVSDHLEIHWLSSWEELEGYHFDFGICHSNGCTDAIDAHRSGVMRVDNFLALGTDWTSKDFRPGDLKGAKLTFFVKKGDLIWKILAPEWARITEDTPGLKFSVPFNHPKEIPQGLRDWFTQGRADPDTFPVILLDTPAGQARPHSLVKSYFPAIEEWMKSEGRLQKALKKKIRELDDSSADGPTPFPPGGGGGGGGGAQGTSGISSPHGPPLLPTTPGADPRGGVSAEIHIHPQEFGSQ